MILLKMFVLQKKMYIGEQTAEEIKKQIATAIPGDNVETISISGRDVETGLPHAIEINSNELNLIFTRV